MTTVAARTASMTDDVRVLGEARLLAGLDRFDRLDLAAHHSVHGAVPSLDRARLERWTAEVRLLGRGGAAFPLTRKLAALPARGSIAVVVNGSESEPASHKDRVLMRRAPHLVLDGVAVVAGALGARDVVVSVHDGPAAESLRGALVERTDLPGIRVVHSGAGFVTGEGRALLAGAGGNRPLAPGRRVHATTRGLNDTPTLLANVETFAQLAVLARTGPGGFARTGSSYEPGTRLFTVGGSVARPGVVEAPAGVPLDVLVGSVSSTAGVLLGGYHGMWTSPTAMPGALNLDAVSVSAAGLSLGAGVVMVVDDSTCPLGEVARVARWLGGESAGQCGPCLFGLPAIAEDLNALLRGEPHAAERTARHLDMVDGRGACAHPDGTVRFVASALAHFRSDAAAHAAAGGCGRAVHGVLPLPDGVDFR